MSSCNVENINTLRTLVLNADMRPISWSPLSFWSAKDAVVAVIQKRVLQLETYNGISIRTPSKSFDIPSVISLKKYHKRQKVPFTRYNVFLRDQFCCQYCGKKFPAKDLTFDHVVPRSKGGELSWLNIVSSCRHDNQQKGNNTLKESKMHLHHPPREPSPYELDKIGQNLTNQSADLHQSWVDYLYWDSELSDEI